MGVTNKACKFEIQLSIRENLQSKGYKISQIGSRNYCEFLGFHSFPGFMYNRNLSESEKIILFNNYIKRLENDENPDLIVIGIPGGIMKRNDTFTSYFGIFAYEISQAVTPDYVICSTQYQDFKHEYFIRLANSFRYKYGFEADCFNFANVMFDWVKSEDKNEEVYLSLDYKFIDKIKKRYQDLHIPLYNIFNIKDSQEIVDNIIKKLGEYSEIEVI